MPGRKGGQEGSSLQGRPQQGVPVAPEQLSCGSNQEGWVWPATFPTRPAWSRAGHFVQSLSRCSPCCLPVHSRCTRAPIGHSNARVLARIPADLGSERGTEQSDAPDSGRFHEYRPSGTPTRDTMAVPAPPEFWPEKIKVARPDFCYLPSAAVLAVFHGPAPASSWSRSQCGVQTLVLPDQSIPSEVSSSPKGQEERARAVLPCALARH